MIIGIDGPRGRVTLDDVLIPGIFQNLSIQGAIIIDSANVEGSSGARKQATGWEDADIGLTLLLLDDPANGRTAEDALADVISVFKTARDGAPVVYRISHPQLNAWHVRTVLFAGIQTRTTQHSNEIRVELSFVEHDPRIATTQERQGAEIAEAAEEDGPPEGFGVTEEEQAALAGLVQ